MKSSGYSADYATSVQIAQENVSSITFGGSVINCLVNEGHREEIFLNEQHSDLI